MYGASGIAPLRWQRRFASRRRHAVAVRRWQRTICRWPDSPDPSGVFGLPVAPVVPLVVAAGRQGGAYLEILVRASMGRLDKVGMLTLGRPDFGILANSARYCAQGGLAYGKPPAPMGGPVLAIFPKGEV